MTTLLILSFALALVGPHLIPRFAHRQRRVALERFGQRVTARRALIQGDLNRAAHDQAFRGVDRLRLLSGLHAERARLDLHVHHVQAGRINPNSPLPARPLHQWRPSPPAVPEYSVDQQLTREQLEDHARTIQRLAAEERA